MYIKNLVLLLALMFTLTPSIAEPTVVIIEDTLIKREFSLKLELPNGFQVKSKEGPDFDFYEIHKGSKTYLAVYSGANPDFPHEHIDDSEVSYLNVCVDDNELRREVYGEPLGPIRILSEWRDGRLVHRELLARYSLGGGWPTYLHAITTRHLSEDELQIADRILFSLQLKTVEQGKENLPSSND